MFLDIYITFIYLRFVPQLPMQGRFKKEFDIFTPGPYILSVCVQTCFCV